MLIQRLVETLFDVWATVGFCGASAGMVMEGFGIVAGQNSLCVTVTKSSSSLHPFLFRELRSCPGALHLSHQLGYSSLGVYAFVLWDAECGFIPHWSKWLKENKKNTGGVRGKTESLSLKSAPPHFHFEPLFHFPVDVYKIWQWLGTSLCSSLLNSVVVSCMPTVPSHLALVFLSLFISVFSYPFFSESIDFSSAGNETLLPCDSQQERGTWAG